MSYELPSIRAGKRIHYDHFPDPLCTFVYRNWNMLPASVLAETVETDEAHINALAGEMGLPVPGEITADWRVYGYITIIRANWHLVTYEQLCTLLGWSMEELAFTLKEDDFLDVKLGRLKPDLPKLVWHELTPEQHEALIPIREATEAFSAAVPAESAKPFDFAPLYESVEPPRGVDPAAKPRFKDRIVYSYSALYGDAFTSGLEYSFPESLLKAYQAVGINGIWCQAVLYKLTPFPFEPAMSEGWKERLEGLRKLTERMAKYGIRLFLYLNEPRCMPLSFFKKYPHLQGETFRLKTDMDSAPRADAIVNACLCTSTPEVQKYLTDSVSMLVREVPLLGGFFTITASENHTNCYSHQLNGETNCPRCKKRTRAEVIAEVNTLIYKAAASVKPDIRMIAWIWNWDDSMIADAIDRMPKEIAVMAVSERAVEKVIGGVQTSVLDYSISVVGPGKMAKGVWETAHKAGHDAAAKCQFNNTWECSFTPFLPAFGQVYQHMTSLCREGVDSVMLGWTLGGFPSPTFSMLSPLFYQSESIPTLRELYENVFPEASVDAVEAAGRYFTEAFDHFPFHIKVAYRAPHLAGPSNLLYAVPSGFESTMTGIPYDDLDNWRSMYPEDVFEEQFRLMSSQWEKGLHILSEIPKALIAQSPALRLLADAAEASYCHFRSVYLQIRFVRVRDGRAAGDLAEIAREEALLAMRLAAVQAHDPTIGFDSANHYFYNRAALMEKYVNCRYMEQRFGK